jgi:hypothetical protein
MPERHLHRGCVTSDRARTAQVLAGALSSAATHDAVARPRIRVAAGRAIALRRIGALRRLPASQATFTGPSARASEPARSRRPEVRWCVGLRRTTVVVASGCAIAASRLDRDGIGGHIAASCTTATAPASGHRCLDRMHARLACLPDDHRCHPDERKAPPTQRRPCGRCACVARAGGASSVIEA